MSAAQRRLLLAWIGVVVLSVVSFGAPGIDADLATLTALVVVVAGIKAAAIGLEFMELRHARRALRIAYLGWALAMTVALVLLLRPAP